MIADAGFPLSPALSHKGERELYLNISLNLNLNLNLNFNLT